MKIDKVNFKKFTIDPQSIIDDLPRYKPLTWDKDWGLAYTANGDYRSIAEWMKNNAVGTFQMSVAGTGFIVGFSDVDDAMLFKISYNGE